MASTRSSFPRTVTLGRKAFEIRWMRAGDAERLLGFARSLDEDDLLFLRMDITKMEAVQEFVGQIDAGMRMALIAERDGIMVGYGSLNRRPVNWQRHLGELRVIVGKSERGSGLGSYLAEHLFATARDMGLTKMVVQMAREQDGARRMFQRLGFTAEALLADWIIDRDGRQHDLVLMAHDVTALTESA